MTSNRGNFLLVTVLHARYPALFGPGDDQKREAVAHILAFLAKERIAQGRKQNLASINELKG